MRITHKTLFEGNLYNLGELVEDMHELNTVVATGKQINDISDDPVGLSRVLELRSNISNLEQLERNISTGRTWLTMGETALTEVTGVISQAKEVCVQTIGANSSASERVQAAQVILGDLLHALGLANTTVNGQYVFSGTKTDTKPYVVDDETTPTATTYSGNTGAFTIKTGKDTDLAVGHNGQAIFDNLFTTLINLKGYLESNDTAGIGTAMDELDSHFDSINQKVAEIGSKNLRLDIKEKIIIDFDLRYKENISEIEDADIAEAIINLKSTELAYQAALASSAKVMQLSLVQFL